MTWCQCSFPFCHCLVDFWDRKTSCSSCKYMDFVSVAMLPCSSASLIMSFIHYFPLLLTFIFLKIFVNRLVNVLEWDGGIYRLVSNSFVQSIMSLKVVVINWKVFKWSIIVNVFFLENAFWPNWSFLKLYFHVTKIYCVSWIYFSIDFQLWGENFN